MTNREQRDGHWAARKRRVVATCVILGLVTLAVGWGYLVLAQRKHEAVAFERTALHARVLESIANNRFNGLSAGIRSAADDLESLRPDRDASKVRDLLSERLGQHGSMRSLSLVDRQGLIVASTEPVPAGATIPLNLLGPEPTGKTVKMGPWLPVRELIELGHSELLPNPTGAITLMRRVESPNGPPLLLVGLINPDSFATQHSVLIGPAADHVALFSYDGMLLVHGARIHMQAGSRAPDLPPFAHFLPEREHGSYKDNSVNGTTAIGSFRTLRNWPLVVVAESDHDDIFVDLREHAVWAAGGVGMAWLALAAVGLLVHRGNERERRSHLQVDALHAQVAESEERWQRALEGAGDGVWDWDVQSGTVICSPRLHGMLGYRPGEISDRVVDWLPLFHAQDVVRLQADIVAHLKRESPMLRGEFRMKCKDGTWRWLLARGTAGSARGAGGRFTRLIGTVVDISERKKVEADSQNLLHRYRETATELERQRLALDKHTLVSITDADGTILYANSRLCVISGYPEGDLVGRRHALIASPTAPASAADGTEGKGLWPSDVQAEVRADLLAHIDAGTIWQGELLHRKKDGTPFWAASTVVPMRGEAGRLEQVFFIETDITQRIEAERAAAQARDIEMHIGARIQQTLLSALPDQRLPKTWLSAHSKPSQGIDGDFMHVLTVGDHCIDLITADVMGKGIGAALIGAAAKMQLSQCMAELMADSLHSGLPQPSQVVAALHRAMVPNLLALEAFITLTYVRIDSLADTVTWVGCGHEEPLFVGQDGTWRTLANQHPPIGVLDHVNYEQQTLPMREGDAVFTCSDGISDALKADHTRIGRDAVEATVRRLLGTCRAPGAVIHALQHELIVPGVRTVDDMTLMLAVRTGDTRRASRRELPYRIEALEHVRGLVNARCAEAGFDEATTGLFAVACVEAFTNIVRHSTGRVPESAIEILVLRERGCLAVEFVYLADPVVVPAPLETSFDEYPEGGFGLTIMRDATDLVEHDHVDGINTIRLLMYCED